MDPSQSQNAVVLVNALRAALGGQQMANGCCQPFGKCGCASSTRGCCAGGGCTGRSASYPHASPTRIADSRRVRDDIERTYAARYRAEGMDGKAAEGRANHTYAAILHHVVMSSMANQMVEMAKRRRRGQAGR